MSDNGQREIVLIVTDRKLEWTVEILSKKGEDKSKGDWLTCLQQCVLTLNLMGAEGGSPLILLPFWGIWERRGWARRVVQLCNSPLTSQ